MKPKVQASYWMIESSANAGDAIFKAPVYYGVHLIHQDFQNWMFCEEWMQRSSYTQCLELSKEQFDKFSAGESGDRICILVTMYEQAFEFIETRPKMKMKLKVKS